MRKKRSGVAKAVVGVVLVGGASGAILWWNSGSGLGGGGLRGPGPEVASAETVVRGESVVGREAGSSAVVAVPPASQVPVAVAATAGAATGGVTAGAGAGAGGATGGGGVGGVTQGVAWGLVGTREAVTPPISGGAAATWAEPRPITAASPSALREGKSLQEAGRLVEARKLVNGALLRGDFTDEGDLEAAKQLLRQVNEVLVFSPQRVAGDEWVDSVTIRPGDRLTRIANEVLVPYEFLLRINGISDARRIRSGQTIKVIRGPIHAVVDKRKFTMDLFLGSAGGPDAVYLTTFRVGLGSNDSTPTGLWRVTPENKLKNPTYFSPRGEGVIHADDPMNPLGEFWIGLTGVEGASVGKMSYGIHGTIDPKSIGRMESMGCIRMLNEDVEQVFQMLFEGRSTVRVIE